MSHWRILDWGLIITNQTLFLLNIFLLKLKRQKIVVAGSFLNVSLGFKVLVCSPWYIRYQLQPQLNFVIDEAAIRWLQILRSEILESVDSWELRYHCSDQLEQLGENIRQQSWHCLVLVNKHSLLVFGGEAGRWSVTIRPQHNGGVHMAENIMTEHLTGESSW